jgi:hypothetical protein
VLLFTDVVLVFSTFNLKFTLEAFRDSDGLAILQRDRASPLVDVEHASIVYVIVSNLLIVFHVGKGYLSSEFVINH